MKVKTDYVPDDVDYLTAGKEYIVYDPDDFGGKIIADDGDNAIIYFSGCEHLRGEPWTVVEE